MKSFCSSRQFGGVAAVCGILLVLALIPAGAKPIRLRNQLITPENAPTPLVLAPGASPRRQSGLFLVQFRQPPDAAARLSLARAGIELLEYIPEDTFLVRCRNAPVDRLQALPSVAWVGPYRAEHKVLPAIWAKAKAAGEPLSVAVLLVPGAAPGEVAAARRSFRTAAPESALRAGTILRGQATAQQIEALAASETVLWIEPARPMKLNDEVASKIVAGDGGTWTLFTQQLGYDGRGVKVAVADSGLDTGEADTMHPDLFGRTPAFFFYGTNLTDAADEHSHGTHVAGIIAGANGTDETDENGALYGLGVAPGASIIAQRIFDGAGNYEAPPSFSWLVRDALHAGADIGSNSWGDDTQGRYDLSAMEFDELVRDADSLKLGDQPYILEFSAGNAGPGAQTIGSPAVAKNVIATGASENDRPDFLIYADGQDAMADFSSRGPCEDGRIKPDVVAPGTWIASLQSAYASAQYAWSAIDDYYQYQGGTSQAGPHVSGAAAVFVQFYRQSHAGATPSPALVKAALINSAFDMFDDYGTGPVPNNDEGWGRVDLTQLIGMPEMYRFLDQSVLLTNGQVHEQRVLVDNTEQPLRLTLAYTDVAAFPGAIPALVNDLDLEVVGPFGDLYRGNQFADGESVASVGEPDNRNNVESVYFYLPVPGEYTVRVRARNIVQDARVDTPAVDQDFALVISGSFAAPGTGIVTMDRTAYRVPDTIHLRLLDNDLAGLSTATISLRSGTESGGETLVLQASGTSGLFTGLVATATGAALHDGRLQVSHGDLIEALYADASPSGTRYATAAADLLPPVITNVVVTGRYGHGEVRWTTDEPAASLVRFGTNTVLGWTVTNSAFQTNHIVSLTGLIAGVTNYVEIRCIDQAGNSATNNNHGQYFTVVVPRAPAILLVDALVVDFFEPPLANYTQVLDQLGLAYDVWSAKDEPIALTAADLMPYRVVIWRSPEASMNGGLMGVTFTTNDIYALTHYLDAGGALFMASEEATTRLHSEGFDSFLHNYLHVAQYTEDVEAPDIDGLAGDPIGNGLSLTTDFSVDYYSYDTSDTIAPGTNAVSFLVKSGTGSCVGLHYPRLGMSSTHRVVFLSFPFDTLPLNDPPNDRATLLRRILMFLAPGLNGEGSVAFDRGAYTIPSQLTIEVADSDLETQTQATVTVFTTLQPGGTPLSLPATTKPGIFRGTLSLAATNTSGSPTVFRVRNGDTVRADYADASLNATVSALALVDTNAPLIFGVASEPGYVDALIAWETSELSDAAVEFGESPLLGRSAAVIEETDYHEVTLYGLQPNRTYYFRLVSRDIAGNTEIDDNGGALYTLTTLLPLAPPWSDDLEQGDANWTVYTPDESEQGWTLGAPSLLLGDAHSPTHCWGSNLDMNTVSQVESYLISPAIFLTNGNKATLRFWQNYDFTMPLEYDIYHVGEVLLIPNNALSPVTLASYSDDAWDWHEVQFDLTPYLGQIVYVAWHYFLFSMDSWPRQGWMIDDVAITSETVQPGTLLISNNLTQARYEVAGPSSFSRTGSYQILTNAAAGQYVIVYGDIPYYVTPRAQTNTLAQGGTLVFRGTYSFPDVNQNGISDLWEQRFFGNVSTNRTRWTDSDGDGMSDYAEFAAGTDPNSPSPVFTLSITRTSASACRIQWPAAAGQQYRLLSSTNAMQWTPFASWFEATGAVAQASVPIAAGGTPAFFRVQAGTTNSPAGLPANLRLAAQPTANGAIHLQWTSVANHAYRVLGSTNGTAWTPVSDWIQATTSSTTYSPPSPSGNPSLFRLEVIP